MTKTYQIEARNGVIFGPYEAADQQSAISAYLDDAGYSSVEDAADVCGQTVEQFLADIIVTDLPSVTTGKPRPDEIAYDLSRKFGSIISSMEPDEAASGRGPAWETLLETAATYMDDDIREDLHSNWDDSLSPCDFLAVYSARHEERFGTPFCIV